MGRTNGHVAAAWDGEAREGGVMKTAQDLMNGSGEALAGFNRRIYGENRCTDIRAGAAFAGWSLADGMIRAGKIFSVHNFHHTHGGCQGHAFEYGGTWVCNTCNHSGLDRPWWIIKVYADGNAWCCIGEGFEDLQSSDNYAFGDTREEAIQNYGDLMTKPATAEPEKEVRG